MSVAVIARLQVDPNALVELFTTKKDVFEGVAKIAKQAGVLHHQFLLGDGEVLILDEWPDAESFQRFFSSNTDVAALMADAGVQGPPEISVYATTDSPDKF